MGSTTPLPAGYWWSNGPASACLYLRYGWVATVTAEGIRVGADPPLWGEVRGPCRGMAQGRRFVEAILAIRLCLGPPERAAFRQSLVRRRVRAMAPHAALGDPDGEDALRFP